MTDVVVGRVAKPHGLKGEVAIEVHTDRPEERFTVGARAETDQESLTVESVRFHKGRPVVRFAEARGRDAAEKLRGRFLYMDVATDEDVDDDEIHDIDLIGMEVVEHDGDAVGTVRRVDHGPAHETLVVSRSDRGTALIPFVADMIIDIDVEEGVISVDLPDGLLDL
ncbi:ribosome maturation factor RimM [Haloglycomyces albus]|uniref:ribosome maturation factor RimM n=1 Tax=Haloglycomyces albus TaxID=526067 RepID=UPI00046CDE1D|nr:ribosome maturation factor RimM [Haloglycomyces albus]